MPTSLQEAFETSGFNPATFFTATVAAKPQAKPTPLRVAKAEQKPAPQPTKTAVAEEPKPAIMSRFSAADAAALVSARKGTASCAPKRGRGKRQVPVEHAPHAFIAKSGRICWPGNAKRPAKLCGRLKFRSRAADAEHMLRPAVIPSPVFVVTEEEDAGLAEDLALLAGPRHPHEHYTSCLYGRHVPKLGNIDEACGAMASGQPGHSLYACIV